MAKKKTSKKVAPIVTTEVSGNVTISKIKGKRVMSSYKIHNSGTALLFQGLLYSLGGETYSAYVPKYLGVGKGNSTASDFNRLGLVDEYVSITRQPITTNFTSSVVNKTSRNVSGYCKVMLPYSVIGTNEIKEIGLFGTINTNTLLARVQLTGDDIIQLESPEEQAQIEWVITLSNATIQ